MQRDEQSGARCAGSSGRSLSYVRVSKNIPDLAFQGNPGTGKTSLARVIAQLLHRIGIIQTDLLVEVQRDKLVAEYAPCLLCVSVST